METGIPAGYSNLPVTKTSLQWTNRVVLHMEVHRPESEVITQHSKCLCQKISDPYVSIYYEEGGKGLRLVLEEERS